MTLQDLGNIGEFVGAIGVVASLIYLALQIRQNSRQISQNTSAVKVASADSYLQYGASMRGEMIRDPDVARIWITGMQDFESLPPEDRTRFRFIMLNFFYGMQNNFLHTQEGVVESEFWEGDERALRLYLREPGVRAWWGREQSTFVAPFVILANSLLEEVVSSEADSSGSR